LKANENPAQCARPISFHALSVARNAQGKTMSTRIVSMLTKLGRRNHEVREVTVSYSGFDYGNDNDCDNDNDNDHDNE
jgi:hypothetical protein